MKIRSGFVSNSSSSSFIVGFPRIPSSPEDLEKMMFKESGEITPYDFVKPMTTLEIAKVVFSDMQEDNWKKRRLTKRKAVKAIQEGSFPGDPPYSYKDRPSDKMEKAYREETGLDAHDDAADPKIKKLIYKTRQEEWALDRKLRETAAKAFIEGFWPRVRGMKVFQFEYADDGGQCVLEHGNIFRAFPHVQISKH